MKLKGKTVFCHFYILSVKIHANPTDTTDSIRVNINVLMTAYPDFILKIQIYRITWKNKNNLIKNLNIILKNSLQHVCWDGPIITLCQCIIFEFKMWTTVMYWDTHVMCWHDVSTWYEHYNNIMNCTTTKSRDGVHIQINACTFKSVRKRTMFMIAYYLYLA